MGLAFSKSKKDSGKTGMLELLQRLENLEGDMTVLKKQMIPEHYKDSLTEPLITYIDDRLRY